VGRLLLVRHASTSATRRAAFPLDEALDPPGILHARALGRFLARADRAIVGPSAAARQTAVEAGLTAEEDAALAGWNAGSWAGLTLEEIEQRDADGLRAWRLDPAARPHGGESLRDLVERARRWVGRMASSAGRTAAVTDGSLARAAVVAALDAPIELYWSIDISPASITELSTREGDLAGDAARGWRLIRSNWTPPVPE
jgi:broad specificity phosphatase PhoE